MLPHSLTPAYTCKHDTHPELSHLSQDTGGERNDQTLGHQVCANREALPSAWGFAILLLRGFSHNLLDGLAREQRDEEARARDISAQ